MTSNTIPHGREIPDGPAKNGPYRATQEARYRTAAAIRHARIILNREYGNRFQCTNESIVITASTTVPSVQSIMDNADLPE